jgi:hypothetical protein
VLSATDSSTVVAGAVRLVGGNQGNSSISSTSSTSSSSDLRRRLQDVVDGADEHRLAERVPDNSFVAPAQLIVSDRSTITINGKLELVPGVASTTNLVTPVDGSVTVINVNLRSTLNLNGDAAVTGYNGGSTTSSSELPGTLLSHPRCCWWWSSSSHHNPSVRAGGGGLVSVSLNTGSSLWTRGNFVLQGGNSGSNLASGNSSLQGSVIFRVSNDSRVDQTGRVVLRDGQGLSFIAPGLGVSMSRSAWVVYACDGASLEMPTRDGNAGFRLFSSSTFQDCRGSGAKQLYPEPLSDGSADGSCSPCTCSAAPFNTCPEKSTSSSASSLRSMTAISWALSWW